MLPYRIPVNAKVTEPKTCSRLCFNTVQILVETGLFKTTIKMSSLQRENHRKFTCYHFFLIIPLGCNETLFKANHKWDVMKTEVVQPTGKFSMICSNELELKSTHSASESVKFGKH